MCKNGNIIAFILMLFFCSFCMAFDGDIKTDKKVDKMLPNADKKAVDTSLYIEVKRPSIDDMIKDKILPDSDNFLVQYPKSPILGHRVYKSIFADKPIEIDSRVDVTNVGGIYITPNEFKNVMEFIKGIMVQQVKAAEMQKKLKDEKIKAKVEAKQSKAMIRQNK